MTTPESTYDAAVIAAIGQAIREAETICRDCGGLNGAHGLVHVRYSTGGGGYNHPCRHADPTPTTSTTGRP